MSLSKPDVVVYVSDLARLLVDGAIAIKPTMTSYAWIYALQHIMVDIPGECSNELMRIIIVILKQENRPDLLPMLSHQACDTLVIKSKGQHLVPDVISNIGYLNGLKTLKVQSPSGFSNDDLKIAFPKRRSDEKNLLFLAHRIRFLTNLRLVHLPNICTTEILQSIISSCPLLEDLDISGSEVDVSVIRDLAKCENLRYLNIDGVGSEEELAPHVAFVLQKNRNLLSLAKFDILSVMDYLPKVSMSFFDKCEDYNLEYAYLRNRDSDVDIVKMCVRFPFLEKIESEKTFGAHLGCLRLFPNLTSLILNNESVTDLQRLFAKANGKFQQVNIRGSEKLAEIFETCSFQKLSTLVLCLCADVDLEIIVKSSPNLSEFAVEECAVCEKLQQK